MATEADDIAPEIGPHVVQFYERDSDLIANVGAHLVAAARADEAAVVIATPTHRDGLEAALFAAGIDVSSRRERGLLVMLDAAETMAQFVVDGVVDAAAFQAVVGGVLRDTAKTGRPIRAYGEMVALLWDRGDVIAAIELEARWNDLARELPFSLLCAYRTASVFGSAHREALEEVCHLHSSVVRTAATRSFPAQLSAPRAARRFVLEVLRQWGYCALLDDAAIVSTELTTNAVMHATSAFTLSLRSEGDVVRVSVEDASPAMPTLRDRGTMALSGRGIALTAGIASRWGAETTDHGKVVWAELSSCGSAL